MTISGGQILHKAVYPGSFPQIQKREPAMRKFLSSFLFTGTLCASGTGRQTLFFRRSGIKIQEYQKWCNKMCS